MYIKEVKKMTALKDYFSVAQAITALLHPHAEVVIHDLKTGQIAAIYSDLNYNFHNF